MFIIVSSSSCDLFIVNYRIFEKSHSARYSLDFVCLYCICSLKNISLCAMHIVFVLGHIEKLMQVKNLDPAKKKEYEQVLNQVTFCNFEIFYA